MSRSQSSCHVRGRLSRISFLRAILGVGCLANVVSAQIPDVPGWEIVWNDEFDGTSLNTQNWTALDRKDSFNNEKQYYHPNQVAVSGGNLQLTAINVPRQGKSYQSGLITSNDLFGPGRFEARVDLPTSQGMWPAFWLNANQVPWPQGGEIDILENRGSQPNLVSSAYHWQTNPGPCCGQHQFVYDEYTATVGGLPVNFHAGFHTFAAEWDETSIKYYVDGNLHFTVTETADRPIFETPKNIIVNLAVGGDFGGDPNGSTIWPQTMTVDYVRYWQREAIDPEPGSNLLTNADFDDAGGSLTGWNTFGNSIGNVSANGDLANTGADALKLYGQFNGPNNLSGVSQGVAITAGDSLRAMASSRTPSWDTLFGKSNDVTMKLEFYSVFGAASGSSGFLGEVSQIIHNGTTAENIWFDHELEAVAPANAVEARLSFVFRQPGSDNGAIWIDSAGLFLEPITDGDFDFDGDVDGRDFLLWQRGGSPNPFSATDLAAWQNNHGSPPPLAASLTVPEPNTAILLLVGMMVVRSCHRCRSIEARAHRPSS
ncbi:MAG: glycoside hydrolase family 16 protein [Bythopirellula sp.]|nr:glycoside hydrolase family 16 protein [Bythopirellula sp.]